MEPVVATVSKVGACIVARVAVEVDLADGDRLKFDLTSPAVVEAADGDPIRLEAIEAACISGAGYAVQRSRLRPVSVVIREVGGRASALDADGFAYAAALAVSRSVGREDTLAELEGWQPLE